MTRFQRKFSVGAGAPLRAEPGIRPFETVGRLSRRTGCSLRNERFLPRVTGFEVVPEFPAGLDGAQRQPVAVAGAGDVEQLAFGVVDIRQVGLVAHHCDPLLRRDNSPSRAITATTRNSFSC